MLFSRSKDQLFYKLMIDVTSNIVEAVHLFRDNVQNLHEKEQYADKIKELESKGDTYTHQLIQELNQTFVTPLDHEDILKLASNLDDILDGIEACAARFVYFHVHTPNPYFMRFTEIFISCAHFLQEAFISLEKRDYHSIRKISVEINNLENEGDKLMREGISALFEDPSDIVNLIKMKEIYERLEHVTDAFEAVMNVMEGVVMKYA